MAVTVDGQKGTVAGLLRCRWREFSTRRLRLFVRIACLRGIGAVSIAFPISHSAGVEELPADASIEAWQTCALLPFHFRLQARPLETNVLIFHYVLEGPADTPYAGGHYHGVLKFPHEYPHKPPEIIMYTPSGRFDPGKALCLSMSSFHPETWNPVWSVSSVLVGLQSFMTEGQATMGSIETTSETKRKLAAESLAYNCTNKDFRRLFPELVELRAAREAELAAQLAARVAAGAAAPPPVPVVPPSSSMGSLTRAVVIGVVVVIAVVVATLQKRRPDLSF